MVYLRVVSGAYCRCPAIYWPLQRLSRCASECPAREQLRWARGPLLGADCAQGLSFYVRQPGIVFCNVDVVFRWLSGPGNISRSVFGLFLSCFCTDFGMWNRRQFGRVRRCFPRCRLLVDGDVLLPIAGEHFCLPYSRREAPEDPRRIKYGGSRGVKDYAARDLSLVAFTSSCEAVTCTRISDSG